MPAFIISILIIAFTFYLLSAMPSHDDTDRADGARSGLSLYIDNATGCHYLGTGWIGLTPRLDKDGKQICHR